MVSNLYSYKLVPTELLVPYARNARQHSDEQTTQIAQSIRQFGFINPVITDATNNIIAGHGRVMAAHKLGLKSVPTLAVTDLTDAQKRAYILADNKLALNASWNTDLLRIELDDLRLGDFNIDVIGFSTEELAALSAVPVGLTDPDEVPPIPARAVTQAGDVWLLGGHRLVCGDSTDPAAVGACVGQERPHLMVTDPPYGVSYDPNWRNEPEKLNLKSTSAFKGRKAATGRVLNDDRSDWTEAWALFAGDVAYIWHGERQGPDLALHMRSVGFDLRNEIVWAKDSLVISRGHYHPQHEQCSYLVRAGKTARWAGDRKQATLWEISKNRQNETGHSTQKPVECMRRPIVNNSKAGDAVYEPFSGSGTTIIAGEQTGRRVLAIELSPVYVDVAVQRWQNFTGKQATLEATGSTYANTMELRYNANEDGRGSYEEWMTAKRTELHGEASA